MTLLGMGMVIAPFATTAADAKSGCTPRGKHKHYPPGQCKFGVNNSNPAPGETITGDGEGYASNSTQDISIQSAPKHLVNSHTDANGDFVQDITIPCDTTPGDHTLFAAGADQDGDPLTLSAGINVKNTACVLGTQTTATTTKTNNGNGNGNGNEQARGSSTLPFTGNAATVLLLILACGLIGAGGVAVTAARRRRAGGLNT